MHIRYLFSLIILVQYFNINAAPTILNTNEKILHFYYHDSLGYGHPINIKKGSTKIFINGPVLLFEADKNQIPYLIYPGEIIDIQKDRNKYSVFTINKNVERNNQLYFFKFLIEKTGGIYMTWPPHQYQSKTNNLNQVYVFEKQIDKIKAYRLFLLDSFSSKLNVNDEFKKIAKSILLSTAIKDFVLLYRSNSILLKNERLYDKKLLKVIGSINDMEYSSFMPYLYSCLLPVSISIDDKMSTKFTINSNIQFKKAFDFVVANFHGMSRNFLLSRTVYTAIENNLSLVNNYIEKFNKVCTDATYKSLVRNKITEQRTTNLLKGESIVLFSDGTKNSLNSIIERNKGKLIYLDFWASWCSPCRNEMTSSVKLIKIFERRPIVFLFFSIDKSISDWKRAVKEEDINTSNSYLILNSDRSPFINQYKIQSIPRYILIGKKGKIISEDAPRPSDPGLIQLIDKNL